MLRCKEVAELVASDAWREPPLTRRMSIWLHLAMCRHCRAYALQISRIGALARQLYEGVRADSAATRHLIAAVREAAEQAPPPGSSEPL